MGISSHDTASNIAADETQEYLTEVERLDLEIAELHRQNRLDPDGRDLRRHPLGQAHHRLGIALKLADVCSNLAIREEIRALRDDLAAASSAGGVRRIMSAADRCL